MVRNYELFNYSDPGKKRSVNEDYFATYQNENWLLLILCDGMGGVRGGKIASRLAVKAIGEFFRQKFEEPIGFLRESMAFANRVVREKAGKEDELTQMGTTVVALLFDGERVFYAHVGDSRLYLFRENSFTQITEDHSYVQELVSRGLLSPEAARSHEQKNKITRCIGYLNSEPDIGSEPIFAQEKDLFLLCSDGLTDMLADQEIQAIVQSQANIEVMGKTLIDAANEKGGADNITVQLLRITDNPVNGVRLDEARKKKRIPVLAFILPPFLIIILFSVILFEPVRQNATILYKKIIGVKTGHKVENTPQKPEAILRSPEEMPSEGGITEFSPNLDYLFHGMNITELEALSESTPAPDTVEVPNYFKEKGVLLGLIKDGRRFKLVQSGGLPRMPDVIGLNLKEAVAVLNRYGFRVIRQTELEVELAGGFSQNVKADAKPDPSLMVWQVSPEVNTLLNVYDRITVKLKFPDQFQD